MLNGAGLDCHKKNDVIIIGKWNILAGDRKTKVNIHILNTACSKVCPSDVMSHVSIVQCLFAAFAHALAIGGQYTTLHDRRDGSIKE